MCLVNSYFVDDPTEINFIVVGKRCRTNAELKGSLKVKYNNQYHPVKNLVATFTFKF